ncbi:MAG TPA: zinc carboxypeptidase [Microscillaceae bacterium]|nr:zinc carboxypeptidase [Microscillaceae bacterium]
MNKLLRLLFIPLTFCIVSLSFGQDYFYKGKGPFDPKIPSPEKFLGYPIGEYHTRHDLVVAYLRKLAELSDRATISEYGRTHERRALVILTISDPTNIQNLPQLQKKQLEIADPKKKVSNFDNQPTFVNLGYNVHGNEPSGTESSMLTAYTLIASNSTEVKNILKNAVVFIDPTINPDGRDRHTHWANTRRGTPKVSDRYDMEHNESNPSGRTNHYWFDLNRDWFLAVHPESQGKLKWYHQWYPNVVTDFHEMGTNSTYFFEPMKPNGSKDPIMPKRNYTELNDLFAKQFAQDLDSIGSFYFSKEVFDGTYPGYGSSYPDLQGGLALLFEQASSRGHVQETTTGEITFAFTIRNQYTSSLATIKAAVANRVLLHQYLQDFFETALSKSAKNGVKAYVFGDEYDENRTKAFVDKLLRHQIEVYALDQDLSRNGQSFKAGKAYVVPTQQPQYRMIQSVFETYREYRDSVYYDASAWSLVNFYNMPYAELKTTPKQGKQAQMTTNQVAITTVKRSKYAYLIPWDDYFAPAVLYHLQNKGVIVKGAFKPFKAKIDGQDKDFGYGSLLIPVSLQKLSDTEVYNTLKAASEKFKVQAYAANTGFSIQGIDLGSRYFRTLEKPRAIMWVGNGVSAYEAGEVWHLLDTRVNMPITKAPLRIFNRVDLNRYNTMVMVSGNYRQLNKAQRDKIKNWVARGNTLITSRYASSWAVQQKLVKESLITAKKPNKKDKKATPVKRMPYVDAPEILGREEVGGAIFEVDLDITHPLGFGYRQRTLPVYRNSEVWLAPSKNQFSTVAKYTDKPHIDGFITQKNLDNFLKPSASLLVSPVGSGRVVMFADNPNFRGAWYGTNRLFFNALFLGQHIKVPR